LAKSKLADMPAPIFYAVSTGPGDFEELTLKAIRVLKECDVIFYPKTSKNSIALKAVSSVSAIELSQKTLVPCSFSMTDDEKKRKDEYKKISLEAEAFLKNGKSVALLSIGDVSLYSSAARTAKIVKNHGFKVKFISGVNSFSAASSLLNLSLCEKDEKLTVIPGDSFFENGKLLSDLHNGGTKVLMKMARHLKEILLLLEKENLIQNASLVQKAGMEGEKIFVGKEIFSMSEEDFKNSYLSVIIVL